MIIRADHVAGAVFFGFGILVFALSGDLPFGSLSSPGAGMMPKLMAGLMMIFAAVVAFGGSSSPSFGTIDWSDGWHALGVVLITACAIAAYRPLGFIVTMSLLVFALLIIVERRPLLTSAAYGIALTLFAYWLFGIALKSPLERGILWF
jgi:hypothetical protein